MFKEFNLTIEQDSEEVWKVKIMEYTGIRNKYVEFDVWLNNGIYKYDKKNQRYVAKYNIISMIRHKQYIKEEKIPRNKCNLIESYE